MGGDQQVPQMASLWRRLVPLLALLQASHAKVLKGNKSVAKFSRFGQNTVSATLSLCPAGTACPHHHRRRPVLLTLSDRGCEQGTNFALYHLYGYTDALCNDGSAGGFYYAPWSDPAKQNIWLFYLEGGSWCYSNSSCAERKNLMPQLTTSNMWWWKSALRAPLPSRPPLLTGTPPPQWPWAASSTRTRSGTHSLVLIWSMWGTAGACCAAHPPVLSLTSPATFCAQL